MSSRRLTSDECLAILQSLPEDDSGDESDESDSDLLPVVSAPQDTVSSSDSDTEVDSEPSDEAQPSARGRGRGRPPQTTRDPVPPPNNLRAANGIVWNNITGQVASSQTPSRNVLRDKSGPTPFAKRLIGSNEGSAWRLMVDECMLKHIQNCTITEARQKSGDELWDLSLDELDCFFALVYARGVLGSSGLSVKDLWSKYWGPPVFRESMARNRFIKSSYCSSCMK
jgi:hypothetical protein